jgi:hypothetical protein
LPTRLSKIDELTRPDHTFLTPDDDCYFLGEYNARKGFAFSEMNNLINNLQKPMDRRDRPEWRYKEAAIRTSGRMLREALNEEWLTSTTLVPIPSSKTTDDPDYDNRLPRILQEVGKGLRVDARELVLMQKSVAQSHLHADRVSIAELLESMTIAEELADPAPISLGIVDDVLTTGRHFKAVQEILQGRFPNVPIVGVFVARRVPEAAPEAG